MSAGAAAQTVPPLTTFVQEIRGLTKPGLNTSALTPLSTMLAEISGIASRKTAFTKSGDGINFPNHGPCWIFKTTRNMNTAATPDDASSGKHGFVSK